ncbi:Aldo/keto reductase-like protein [Bombardia bombarda]|uniref:Aldo/keto reductase-like protein n=1 Tax=Bombardia bombarda TaxID=252184 RepID=A0AA40C524_9PEZI|nr:Aldo/keto reductase-like protein [Bombardia bombarda]
MAPPATLPKRTLGKNGPQITSIGFGLMGLSVAYGAGGSDAERLAVLDRAWSLGCTTWDSADLYGDNEDLIGQWFKLHPERRADIFLATKFGFVSDGKGGLGLDSSPEHVREAIASSLKRLGVDYVDLYYVHRVDGKTPIEKTMEVLAELKREGKIRAIGLSEVSSRTVRRAYKIAPVDAVQVEYNPWQLDIENDVGTNLLATCRELGITVFAYSPLGRGFLSGQFRSPDDFEADDFRRMVPRYSKENFPKNLELVDRLAELAAKKGCTTSQLTLAWLIAQGNDIIPIPGTKKIKYLEENVAAAHVVLTAEEVTEIRQFVENAEVAGHRNPAIFFAEFADTPEL